MPTPSESTPLDPLTSAAWGLVLSAGGSTRMGRPKGLLELDGRPLLLHHVEQLARGCTQVGVVLGAQASAHIAVLPPWVHVTVNPRWDLGAPSDSLRWALAELPIRPDLLVTPVDVLPPRIATLRQMLDGSPPAVPIGPRGQRGHPVWLDDAVLERVRSSVLPGGLRPLLAHAREVPVPDSYVGEDFDTPDDWQRALAYWRRHT